MSKREILVAPVDDKTCLIPGRRDAHGRMRRLARPTKVPDTPYWRRRIADGGCVLVVESAAPPAYTPDYTEDD